MTFRVTNTSCCLLLLALITGDIAKAVTARPLALLCLGTTITLGLMIPTLGIQSQASSIKVLDDAAMWKQREQSHFAFGNEEVVPDSSRNY